MKITNETAKTYKFVRNTVLSIGLFLSFFIPTFNRESKIQQMNHVENHDTFHAVDSLQNYESNKNIYHLIAKK